MTLQIIKYQKVIILLFQNQGIHKTPQNTQKMTPTPFLHLLKIIYICTSPHIPLISLYYIKITLVILMYFCRKFFQENYSKKKSFSPTLYLQDTGTLHRFQAKTTVQKQFFTFFPNLNLLQLLFSFYFKPIVLLTHIKNNGYNKL